MAENTPTFKLVLVGDGGTGKVSWKLSYSGEDPVVIYRRRNMNTC